ncbi:hypothetical protein [Flavisolibacter tropicus]|uniref:Uncharacterized protein n=1 Tax=Flavisolibacter tropicus TaxID=1492898 RepID=A0A172U127_9BACT|nr:hypothetical protein [Flavisolibacter tropicus]ANE52707.1 hypothetical protein SY85_21740 [Flavisolibacter tropicus]
MIQPNDKDQHIYTSLPKQTTPAPKEEDFSMSVNDNPRANENVYNESLVKENNAEKESGSEITDGEGG